MNNELKIVMKNINDIKPYHRNARYNDETVNKLCEAIKVVGFNVPILIDKNNVIIKGHSRWKAGVKLGLEKLPCIVSENDEETNKFDRLADNKIQEFSKWNNEILNTELASLNIDLDVNDFGFDFDLDIDNDFMTSPVNDFAAPEVDTSMFGNNTPSYTPPAYTPPVKSDDGKEFITEKDVQKTVSIVQNEYGSVTCPKCGNVVMYRK